MNTVVLHGDLTQFGTEFRMAVRSPAEAVRALAVQIKGFRDVLTRGVWVVIREMRNGKLALEEHELMIGMENTRIHIMPYVDGGAKKGAAKIILGIGLIGLTIATGGFGGAAFAGLSLKTAGVMIGLGLIFSGAALLMSPTPKIDDAENSQSFLFSGDINPAGQNFAVPITYGLDRVRPIPVATQIATNQISIGSGQTYNNPYGGTGSNDGSGGGGGGNYQDQEREH